MIGSKKGDARLMVEAAMKTATVASPITVVQIAARNGIGAHLARTHVGNIVGEGLAYNLRPGSKSSAYVWGQRPKPEALPQLRDMPKAEEPAQWAPKSQTCTRPGAMDAYELPSLESGQRVERKRPAIISGKAVDAVGVHGGRF